MMKIIYIKLVNFIGVQAAMGVREIELSFDKIDKPIIQIYGPNRCGKTVLLQQLHPFSSINLSGDERSDLSLVIPGETGIKHIVYEVSGEVYSIIHTYKPTPSGNHTISSSLTHGTEELNPSGGVTVFNNLIEKILGINKYVFQFIINGTQLTSFAKQGTTQRKTLMNKAMGIDIYDKIHKMATDDYRYTNKLIVSLNNTKEYLLSTYGSYENLCDLLNSKRNEHDQLTQTISSTKSALDRLSGEISVIRQQNPSQELEEADRIFSAYKKVVDEVGLFDENMYDTLVNEQIDLNGQLSALQSERLIVMKDIDVLYGKKTDIENTMLKNRRASEDYNNMVSLMNDIKQRIESIHIEEYVTSSSNYLMSMLSLAQAINSTCKEIVTCLNEKHLKLFVDMIEKGVDISAFLIQEGSSLMDSEKEKSVVSRIRNMISSIDGEFPEECGYSDCIYRKTHDALETYFKSYQSMSSSQFTVYDIEQFDHAYKNVQTIRRLINMEISDELKSLFSITSIIQNLGSGQLGVDVTRIKHLMEEAAKIEQRNRYISQLADLEKSIENMKQYLIPSDNMDEAINSITRQIDQLNTKVADIDSQIEILKNRLSRNDNRRMLLSQVQHVDINTLTERRKKLKKMCDELWLKEHHHSTLNEQYINMSSNLTVLMKELDVLEKANTQYIDTTREIEKHLLNDRRYKIIAEATSSTKGKPVIAIREKIESALMMTNRLLDVMYDGEIEMLQPTIDETTFTLPFRCGANTSEDIRYGSQSESTLLALALSLSLSSSLSSYNIPLVDEIDAYLDSQIRDGFILMLQEIMTTLNMEQLFLISHNIYPGQYKHVVQTVNISKEAIKEE